MYAGAGCYVDVRAASSKMKCYILGVNLNHILELQRKNRYFFVTCVTNIGVEFYPIDRVLPQSTNWHIHSWLVESSSSWYDSQSDRHRRHMEK